MSKQIGHGYSTEVIAVAMVVVGQPVLLTYELLQCCKKCYNVAKCAEHSHAHSDLSL